MQCVRLANHFHLARRSIRHSPPPQLVHLDRLRRVAVRAAKLQNQVRVGALVENGILAARVARAVRVRAVTGLARLARDRVAIAGRASEQLKALGLEGVAEDGAEVVVGAVRVGAGVVDGLQRAAEVGLARDGDAALLDVRAGDVGVEGVGLAGREGDDAGAGGVVLGLEVEGEGALVVDVEGRGGGGGGEAGEGEGGEVHFGDGGWLGWLVLRIGGGLLG